MMLMLPRSVEQPARTVSPATARARRYLGMNCCMAHLATMHRTRFSAEFFIRFLARFCRKPTGIVPHSNESRSRLALPAPLFVRLPIGHLEAAVLGFGPAHARGFECIGVLAVE